MTAGDYSGRGYDHDDQGYPPHPDQGGGYEGYAAHPWTNEQQASPAEPDWHAGYGNYSPPGYPRDDHSQTGYPRDDYPPPGYPRDDYPPPGYPRDDYTRGEFDPRPRDDPYRDSGEWVAGQHDPYASAYGSGQEAGAAPWADHTASWRQPSGPEREEDDEAQDTRRGRRRHGKRRGLPLWQEVPLLLIIAFCLAILVRTFLLQAFYIPSGSMENTLLAGDRVLVNKVVYNVREPARGEVVVFRGTDEWTPQPVGDGDAGAFTRVARVLGDLVGISQPEEREFIKRIVGLPGDRISCCDVDGRVFVNGQPLDEVYVTANAPLADVPDGPHDCRTRRFDEVVVEPGQMFVMGDHRAVSQDSRCQGQVPVDNIIGRAFVIVWPSGRWTGLPAPDIFDAVPPAAGQALSDSQVFLDDQVFLEGPVPGESAVMLPILLAAAMTFHPKTVRSGGFGRAGGRRLAE